MAKSTPKNTKENAGFLAENAEPENIKPQLKKNLSIAEQKLKKTLMGKKAHLYMRKNGLWNKKKLKYGINIGYATLAKYLKNYEEVRQNLATELGYTDPNADVDIEFVKIGNDIKTKKVKDRLKKLFESKALGSYIKADGSWSKVKITTALKMSNKTLNKYIEEYDHLRKEYNIEARKKAPDERITPFKKVKKAIDEPIDKVNKSAEAHVGGSYGGSQLGDPEAPKRLSDEKEDHSDVYSEDMYKKYTKENVDLEVEPLPYIKIQEPESNLDRAKKVCKINMKKCLLKASECLKKLSDKITV